MPPKSSLECVPWYATFLACSSIFAMLSAEIIILSSITSMTAFLNVDFSLCSFSDPILPALLQTGSPDSLCMVTPPPLNNAEPFGAATNAVLFSGENCLMTSTSVLTSVLFPLPPLPATVRSSWWWMFMLHNCNCSLLHTIQVLSECITWYSTCSWSSDRS